jgi:hypothetical protein
MKFGPAEMAQVMDTARFVALYRIFFGHLAADQIVPINEERGRKTTSPPPPS